MPFALWKPYSLIGMLLHVGDMHELYFTFLKGGSALRAVAINVSQKCSNVGVLNR